MKQQKQLIKIFIILISILLISCNQNLDQDKLAFNKKVWDINWKKHQSGENDRHYMLNDLIKNHLRIGMDSIDVKKLLGEPERDFNFSYNMGIYESGFDPTFLILEFDQNGKLNKIKVETI